MGQLIQTAPGSVITFWTASSGGAQYTDLRDMSNNPIASVTADVSGFTPQFQGPAGLFEMWADANNGSGPRHLVRANTGALLTLLHDYLKTLTG
jgi:hypothetical protein